MLCIGSATLSSLRVAAAAVSVHLVHSSPSVGVGSNHSDMTQQQQSNALGSGSGPNQHILDVVIVGGGLSGLSLARALHTESGQDSVSWKVVEASPSLGGRLANDNNDDLIDLGGAWIWPGQTHISNLIRGLGLEVFQQPDDPHSFRIVGGAVQIIRRMAEAVPKENLVTSFAVKHCSLDREANLVRLESATGQALICRRAVFAVPPKLLHLHVTFDPPLSCKKVTAQAQSNTWMAGVTKVSLVYETRFWKEAQKRGLSNMGVFGHPVFQVYDASTEDSDKIALTMFTVATGISDDDDLAYKCARQLSNAWGRLGVAREITAQLYQYKRCHVKRWPLEEYISEDKVPKTIKPHPDVDSDLSEVEWDGRLFFAGTECDLGSPGVMEGAVSSAHRVMDELKQTSGSTC